MNTINFAIQRSLEAQPIREPVMRSIIQYLHLPTGSYGLDAGCGIGLQAQLLSEAVGSMGHIAGVDLDFQALAYGLDLVKATGHKDRIRFYQGDFQHLPFKEQSFNWVWSADCIGYPIGGLLPVLKELVRVVKLGGDIIILAWSSQQILPGFPILEARLNAASSAYLPYFEGISPERHFLRAMKWFREAGLEDVKARTFVGDIQAPYKEGERGAVISLFEMLWGDPQPDESPEDRKEYQRLCEPGSPDFILDQPGYYGYFTYTLFQGKTPHDN